MSNIFIVLPKLTPNKSTAETKFYDFSWYLFHPIAFSMRYYIKITCVTYIKIMLAWVIHSLILCF